MQSTIVPILALAVTVCISFKLASQYGVAMAALGMLSTLAIGLIIDYGPISDNAGGIAEMCELGVLALCFTSHLMFSPPPSPHISRRRARARAN
jgi:Na+/H+-translocating membrane pyrophosphatase